MSSLERTALMTKQDIFYGLLTWILFILAIALGNVLASVVVGWL